ncbi:MAG: DUF4139 domain-containing protein [Planctomycetota bacterium]
MTHTHAATHRRSSFTPARALCGLAACLTAAIVGSPAVADDPPAGQGVSLTVYSSADPASFNPQQFIANANRGHNPQFAYQVPGFAVVRDTRAMTFAAGRNELALTDVAQFIDPTTVAFTALDVAPTPQAEAERSAAPGTATSTTPFTILEQQFKFDLVSPDKLFDAYVNREIAINVPLGGGEIETVRGTLLSSNQGRLVLDTPAGIRMVANISDVQLGALPDGLITRPTLSLIAHADQPGDRLVRTAYQTNGLTWRADYHLVLADDETTADLGAWVTLMNLSGAAYPDAELKLIAGDVQRVTPDLMRGRREAIALSARSSFAPEAASFAQKQFFEYHLYTLPRRTTVHENTTQQIALFPTRPGVAVEKKLVYWGLPQARQWGFASPQTNRQLGNDSNKKVDVYLEMQNEEHAGLGLPLPAGKVRVYKADGDPGSPDGSLEFVGEDLIDHTPKGNELLIRVGQAFDVTGDRTQTDFTTDDRRRVMTESFRITLKNAKDQPQAVTIREPLYRWVNWQITESSSEFEKVDSKTVHFDVDVPAEGEASVAYTVRYTW